MLRFGKSVFSSLMRKAAALKTPKTQADRDAIAKAEAKRIRKNAKRLAERGYK